MTTTTTTDQRCPECGGAEGTYWCYSTVDTDVWSCRCGHDWTITVDIPEPPR
jgi:DNA-directed RNA polymerase subunit M/transcription elongation factor TFIIS